MKRDRLRPLTEARVGRHSQQSECGWLWLKQRRTPSLVLIVGGNMRIHTEPAAVVITGAQILVRVRRFGRARADSRKGASVCQEGASVPRMGGGDKECKRAGRRRSGGEKSRAELESTVSGEVGRMQVGRLFQRILFALGAAELYDRELGGERARVVVRGHCQTSVGAERRLRGSAAEHGARPRSD